VLNREGEDHFQGGEGISGWGGGHGRRSPLLPPAQSALSKTNLAQDRATLGHDKDRQGITGSVRGLQIEETDANVGAAGGAEVLKTEHLPQHSSLAIRPTVQPLM
jgi:hypothetical protein